MKSTVIAIVTGIVLATAAPVLAADTSRDGGDNYSMHYNLHTQTGQDHFWAHQRDEHN